MTLWVVSLKQTLSNSLSLLRPPWNHRGAYPQTLSLRRPPSNNHLRPLISHSSDLKHQHQTLFSSHSLIEALPTKSPTTAAADFSPPSLTKLGSQQMAILQGYDCDNRFVPSKIEAFY